MISNPKQDKLIDALILHNLRKDIRHLLTRTENHLDRLEGDVGAVLVDHLRSAQRILAELDDKADEGVVVELMKRRLWG
jgi:CHAD domain-containing protein